MSSGGAVRHFMMCNRRDIKTNVFEDSLPRAELPFDVGCWTFSVRRFLLLQGRVAESGLRHSTRNRAWGNPPWVRIPPLPPVFAFTHNNASFTFADVPRGAAPSPSA